MSNILSGLFVLLPVEACVQQRVVSVLLQQTSAVLQSTTSLQPNRGRKLNGLYLYIFMAMAYKLYLT